SRFFHRGLQRRRDEQSINNVHDAIGSNVVRVAEVNTVDREHAIGQVKGHGAAFQQSIQRGAAGEVTEEILTGDDVVGQHVFEQLRVGNHIGDVQAERFQPSGNCIVGGREE